MHALRRFVGRRWALVALALIAACVHGVMFHLVRHLALSTTILWTVVVLVVIQHSGAIGFLLALLRKRSQKAKDSAL